MNGRYTNILLFEAFENALKQLLLEDSALFPWQKGKAGIAHCFASHLHDNLRTILGFSQQAASSSFLTLPQNMKVDIVSPVGPQTVDILLHDRVNTKAMAILFHQDYLTKHQLNLLRSLQNEGCNLVLGVAFLPQKDYVLIYRSNGQTLDYYHFSKYDYTSSLSMQKEFEEEESSLQLFLGIRQKRKNTKKKSTQTISSEDQ